MKYKQNNNKKVLLKNIKRNTINNFKIMKQNMNPATWQNLYDKKVFLKDQKTNNFVFTHRTENNTFSF